MAGSETINNPGFWSPDSTTFVYPSLRHEWEKVRMPDGAPQGIGPLVGASRGGTWSDAGTILLSLGKMPTFRLSTLPSAGGDLTAVIFSKESGDAGTIPSSLGKTPPFRLSTLPSTGGDLKDVDFPKQFSAGDYIYPEFIPGSEDFLFFYLPLPDAEGGSVYLATLHEGKCVNPIPLLVNETGARYTPAGGGRLLYVRNDNLYSQKLNLRRRALEGEADLVVQGVSSAQRAYFSVARNGTIAWRPGTAVEAQVTEFDRQGNVVSTFGPKNLVSQLTLSPDQQQMLVRTGSSSWLLEIGRRRRIGLPMGIDWFGWSAGSSKIVGVRKDALVEMPASGLGEVHDVRKLGGNSLRTLPVMSLDGRQFLGQIGDDVFSFRMDGAVEETKPNLVMTKAIEFVGPRPSPDGRWILYEGSESGGGLYVAPMSGKSARRQISPVGNRAIWRGDGKEILFISGNTLMSITVEGKESLTFGAARKLFSGLRLAGGTVASSVPLAVSRNGERIFWPQAVEQLERNVIHVKTFAIK